MGHPLSPLAGGKVQELPPNDTIWAVEQPDELTLFARRYQCTSPAALARAIRWLQSDFGWQIGMIKGRYSPTSRSLTLSRARLIDDVGL